MADINEIIKGLKVSDDSSEQVHDTREIRLSNGEKLFVHDEIAYHNHFKNVSLETIEGDAKNLIRFSYDFKFHRNGLRALIDVGSSIRANVMPVYFNNVLWVYSAELMVTKSDEHNTLCQFSLKSVGSQLNKKNLKGGFNYREKSQEAPEPNRVDVSFKNPSGEIVEYPMVSEGSNFVISNLLSLNDLKQCVEKHSSVSFHITIDIPKVYFEINNFFNPNLVEHSQNNTEIHKVLDCILKGEKPLGWNWVITVGQGSPREYFVHREMLEKSSDMLKALIKTHSSMKSINLFMVSHENRLLLTDIHAKEIHVLLGYVYLNQYLIPPFDSFARIGRLLCGIFPAVVMRQFFSHWETVIVNDIKQLKKEDVEKTFSQCGRHLISIESSPPGSMIVAQSCAISTLADTWHLALERNLNLQEILGQLEELNYSFFIKALDTVHKFRTSVASVEKKYI